MTTIALSPLFHWKTICFGGPVSLRWSVALLFYLSPAFRIIWTFNPPTALHFEVIREKLVRSTKKTWIATLENRRLILPVLTTTMCLIEHTLNGRRLILLSDDPEDLEALTPNRFLSARSVVAEPLMPDSARNLDCQRLYKVAQNGWRSIHPKGVGDLSGLKRATVS